MKRTTILEQKIKKEAFSSKTKRYQDITELLMFSIYKTKFNTAFTIFIINYSIKNLDYQYTKVVKTILQYLKRLRN